MALAQGQKAGEMSQWTGVTEEAHYRWSKKYGGLRLDQAHAVEGFGEGEPPGSGRAVPR